MKMNFKKITAITSSLLMTGMTLGVAAAATYPAPFVSNGSADVAIVYGANAQASDVVQAGNIQSNLQSYMGAGEGTVSISGVSGGDSFKFEKTSTKLHLGDNLSGIMTTLDDNQLPILLKSGTYTDKDNDEFDYTQKIAMGSNVQLTMFEDNDYASDTPTVGYRIASGVNVLTYTLSFSTSPLVSDMPTSDLTLMGRDYYVLSNTSTTLTLLDSAESSMLTEGETKSITVDGKTYEVKISGAYSAGVKLDVNGEISNSLTTGETQRLSDGSYLGIKEYNYNSKDSGISDVEFSIGKGKLKITNAADVQINDDAVSGLTGTFVPDSAGKISSLAIAWAADNDLFITNDSEIIMPGFNAVKLSFAGLNYPKNEVIQVEQGGDTYAVLKDFPLKDGKADINFLYGDSTSFTGLGKDASNRLVTAKRGTNLTYDKDTDSYFVISWSDGSDAESYLARFSNFILTGTDPATGNRTDLQYYKDGTWVDKKTGIKDNDVITINNAEITVYTIDRAGKNVLIGSTGTGTRFNTLYSEEGATIYLPYLNTTATSYNGTGYSTAAAACTAFRAASTWKVGEVFTGVLTYNDSVSTYATTSACATSFNLSMVEEDKTGVKNASDQINMTIGWDSSTTPEVEVSSMATSNADATSTQIGETKVWRDFTYSDLSTEILYSKPTSGQKSVKLIYHGDEVAADTYITAPSATVSSTGTTTGATQLGDVLVLDSEVSSVSTKNLVIVGGSAVNAAAAKALGVSAGTSGSAFTTATGVEAGQFLIKGVADVYSTGKIALVVAGYEAADTVNAVTYLKNNAVDTSKSYKGTSSTSATLQVA